MRMPTSTTLAPAACALLDHGLEIARAPARSGRPRRPSLPPSSRMTTAGLCSSQRARQARARAAGGLAADAGIHYAVTVPLRGQPLLQQRHPGRIRPRRRSRRSGCRRRPGSTGWRVRTRAARELTAASASPTQSEHDELPSRRAVTERDMSIAQPVLRAEQISKQVSSPEGTLTILAEVDLQIAAGETVAIVGASGAGKSTLLALLAGLDEPSRGRIWLNGAELTALDEDGRAAVRARHVGLRLPEFSPGALADGDRERDAAARAGGPAERARRGRRGAGARSICRRGASTIRGSCPAASSSASRSRGRSSRGRRCCSRTSRPAISTR